MTTPNSAMTVPVDALRVRGDLEMIADLERENRADEKRMQSRWSTVANNVVLETLIRRRQQLIAELRARAGISRN